MAWQTYGADVPRFVLPQGRLLIEAQRTNLFTTARAPATETVTVTAAAHTLSFIGTGNVTLSGVATGTLAGTGVNDRVTLTFTPTAGSLTLTVAGSITLPQLELGPFASTPILPPVGTPGAATRGTDILTAPLSALGIADNGACAVLWRGVFSATNLGTQQSIASVEDGSNNRYEIRLGAAGIPEIIRVTAAAPSSANFGGVAPTPGDTIRAGMSIDGAGRLAGVVVGYNSGAALAVTGGPTSGLTTFRHGTSQTGAARAMWGETHTLTVLPRVLSDAELQAAVAAP